MVDGACLTGASHAWRDATLRQTDRMWSHPMGGCANDHRLTGDTHIAIRASNTAVPASSRTCTFTGSA